MTNEIALSSDITTITAEINAYKRVAGEAIIEIGRRLKHVKENDLTHGQFGKWLESIDFDTFQASRFIRVYEELSDGNLRTCANIGFRALYEIATLPPDERDKPHTIPSSGETKTVDEMTVRELREVKAALKAKEAEIGLKEAELTATQQEAAKLAEQNAALRDTTDPPRVEIRPDPTLADRLARYEARYGDIDGEVTERISNHTEIDGAAAHFADDIQTLLLSYAHLTTFRAAFVGITDAAYDEYRTSLDALKNFVNGMERVMSSTPKGQTEVIDIKAS